jgi:hypothetical protein
MAALAAAAAAQARKPRREWVQAGDEQIWIMG